MTELNPSSSLASAPSGEPSLLAADGEPVYYGLSLETWLKVAILTPLFIAVYWLVLRWLWDKTNPIYGEANWGHAICIPIVGIYYLYINREDLLQLPVKPTWAGLPITLLGLAAFAYGIWPGQNQFFQGCAMSLTLFGLVLLVCGWKIMGIAWFPIAYLVCGVPWPPLVYSYIASPLQMLAAKVAVVTLRFTGVNAYRTGTKINMSGTGDQLRTLNVAEACAGLRSLMTFITVAVAVAFLSARPLWQKLIITLSAIPIAIFCNVMRVAGQGLLDHYISRQLSESFAHQFVGLVMLVPAFFLILLVGWVLDHLFVEEVDERPDVITRRTPALAMGPVAPVSLRTSQVAPRSAPRVAPKPAAAPGTDEASKPQTPPPPRPAVTPPRPGVIPPRPGIVRRPPQPPPIKPEGQS